MVMALTVAEEIDELKRKITLLGKSQALFSVVYSGRFIIMQMVIRRPTERAHNGPCNRTRI